MEPTREIDEHEHARQVLRWRQARLSRLVAEDGWLSLVGRFWLHEGEQRAGSGEDCELPLPPEHAPAFAGSFFLHAARVYFEPAPRASFTLRPANGSRAEPVLGRIELTTDLAGPPDRLFLGSLSLEVMQRGGELALRVRHPETTARTRFVGIDYYPIRPEWRVVARFEPFETARRVELAYENGGGEPYLVPGRVHFAWDGASYALDPVLDGDRPRLFVLFADETNRDQTYGAGRFLYAPLPQGERVVLDFNQAFSPPCAFSAHAFCPLPPPQNRLSLRVEAGEKRPLPYACGR